MRSSTREAVSRSRKGDRDWGFVVFVAAFVVVLAAAVAGAGWSLLIHIQVDTLRGQARDHIETAMVACAGPQRVDLTGNAITVTKAHAREETAAVMVCLDAYLPASWLASLNETGTVLQVFNPKTSTVGPWSATSWTFSTSDQPLPALPPWDRGDAVAAYTRVAPVMSQLFAYRLANTIPVLFGTLLVTGFAALAFGRSALKVVLAVALAGHVVLSGGLFWVGFVSSRPVNQIPDHTAGATYLTTCLEGQATIDLTASQIVVNPSISPDVVVHHIQRCHASAEATPARLSTNDALPTLVRVNNVSWLVTPPPSNEKDTP